MPGDGHIWRVLQARGDGPFSFSLHMGCCIVMGAALSEAVVATGGFPGLAHIHISERLVRKGPLNMLPMLVVFAVEILNLRTRQTGAASCHTMPQDFHKGKLKTKRTNKSGSIPRFSCSMEELRKSIR